METEKRIGDFRVNRKVAWGIVLHKRSTAAFQIERPLSAASVQAFSTAT